MRCSNGHQMGQGDAFCVQCGQPPTTDQTSISDLPPPITPPLSHAGVQVSDTGMQPGSPTRQHGSLHWWKARPIQQKVLLVGAAALVLLVIVGAVMHAVRSTRSDKGMYDAGYAFGQTAGSQAETSGSGSNPGGLCDSEASLLATQWKNGAALDVSAPGPFDSQGQQNFINGCDKGFADGFANPNSSGQSPQQSPDQTNQDQQQQDYQQQYAQWQQQDQAWQQCYANNPGTWQAVCGSEPPQPVPPSQ